VMNVHSIPRLVTGCLVGSNDNISAAEVNEEVELKVEKESGCSANSGG
jgi:hypothetical protein